MLSVLQLSTGAWPVVLRGDHLVGDAAAPSEPSGERPCDVGAGQDLGHSLGPIIRPEYSASRVGLDAMRSGLEDRHNSH